MFDCSRLKYKNLNILVVFSRNLLNVFVLVLRKVLLTTSLPAALKERVVWFSSPFHKSLISNRSF